MTPANSTLVLKIDTTELKQIMFNIVWICSLFIQNYNVKQSAKGSVKSEDNASFLLRVLRKAVVYSNMSA